MSIRHEGGASMTANYIDVAGRVEADLSRLSLNQMTTQRWSLREAVEGCLEAVVPNFALRGEREAQNGFPEGPLGGREAEVRGFLLPLGGRFPSANEVEHGSRPHRGRHHVEE